MLGEESWGAASFPVLCRTLEVYHSKFRPLKADLYFLLSMQIRTQDGRHVHAVVDRFVTSESTVTHPHGSVIKYIVEAV